MAPPRALKPRVVQCLKWAAVCAASQGLDGSVVPDQDERLSGHAELSGARLDQADLQESAGRGSVSGGESQQQCHVPVVLVVAFD